jgi:hypothetical protein
MGFICWIGLVFSCIDLYFSSVKVGYVEMQEAFTFLWNINTRKDFWINWEIPHFNVVTLIHPALRKKSLRRNFRIRSLLLLKIFVTLYLKFKVLDLLTSICNANNLLFVDWNCKKVERIFPNSCFVIFWEKKPLEKYKELCFTSFS